MDPSAEETCDRREWRRCIVDPTLPFARAAAQVIVNESVNSHGAFADMGAWLVIVPGARAGRLLLHAIVSEAGRRGIPCDAPRMATIGRLIETAFEPPAGAADTASSLERRLAWEATLHARANDLAAPFVPRGAAPDQALWKRLAKVALRCEDELAAADRSFDHAADAVERLGADAARLRALASMATEVSQRLAACGLVAPHVARSTALAHGLVRCARVVLAGTLELSAVQRQALERLPAGLAIVAARPDAAHRFDAYGTATEAWAAAAIDLPGTAILTAESPRDAADAALRFIAERQEETPELACDEIAIAVTSGPDDPSQALALGLAARDAGLDVHDAAGVPLLATPIGRAVAAAASYRSLRNRSGRSVAELATLLRRPSVERLVRSRLGDEGLDPIAIADAARATHLLASLDALPRSPEADRLGEIVALLDRWTEELADGDGAAIRELRGEGAQGDADGAAIRAFEQLCEEVAGIPAELRGGADALELLLELAEGTRLPAEPRERAVEAIGWLELLFEPALHVVVLGMNEGAVPGGGRGDGLLPESVRESLGIETRRRRADRDAALLDLLAARCRSLRLVALRRTEDGDPLVPSRLLLRLGGVPLAERVVAMAKAEGPSGGGSMWRRVAGGRRGFTVPQPDEAARAVDSVGVTDFRAFLASPMRYWLSRIERLEEVDDDPAEIPVPDLGTIVHATLAWFAGRAELRTSTESDRIAEAVAAEFDRRATEMFGTRPLPAVRLQLEILRRRIAPWAQAQARSAWDGWEIVASETPLPEGFEIRPARGKPMRVRGRIDRIDRHRASGAIRIIDYKTSDAGKSPRETHRSGKKGTGAWRDLQLPLYVAGMRLQHGERTVIETGYVRLPSDPRLAGWIAADFSAEELNEALGVAADVVGRIRAGEFALGDAMGPDDPFEGILQCAIFGSREGGESESDGEGGEDA